MGHRLQGVESIVKSWRFKNDEILSEMMMALFIVIGGG